MVDGISNHSTKQPKRPLILALGVSVVVHLLLAVLVQYAPKWEWARKNRLLNALVREAAPLKILQDQQTKSNEKDQEPQLQYPTVFVEIPQEQEVLEPPKDTKYYSDKSSIAANPNPELLTAKDSPKLEGTQDKVIRMAQNPSPRPPPPPPKQEPEQPPQNPPEQQKAAPQQPEQALPKPESEPKVGDLALARPSPSLKPQATAGKSSAQTSAPKPPPPPKSTPRPRTLAQVFEKSPQLRGEKYKQEGGVRKRALTASLDVRASSFGAYDRAVIQAIEERWFQLLEENAYTGERVGKVILDFKLKYDGSVSDMKVVETSVGEVLALLCLRAIKDPSVYEQWPSDMRLLYSSCFREVRFTFYYN